VDAEFYFYGVLTNAGGKNKVNIHLDTEEFGSLTIHSRAEFIFSISGKAEVDNEILKRVQDD